MNREEVRDEYEKLAADHPYHPNNDKTPFPDNFEDVKTHMGPLPTSVLAALIASTLPVDPEADAELDRLLAETRGKYKKITSKKPSGPPIQILTEESSSIFPQHRKQYFRGVSTDQNPCNEIPLSDGLRRTRLQPPQGKKDDQKKNRPELLPPKAVLDIAQILTDGAERYGERNWEDGFLWSRIYGATMRHLLAWWGGQTHDPDSGRNHLAHAACNLVFLLEFEKTHPEMDDRPYGDNDGKQDPKRTSSTPGFSHNGWKARPRETDYDRSQTPRAPTWKLRD